MLGKLVVGEIAVGEVVTGEIVLGKLRWKNDLTPIILSNTRGRNVVHCIALFIFFAVRYVETVVYKYMACKCFKGLSEKG